MPRRRVETPEKTQALRAAGRLVEKWRAGEAAAHEGLAAASAAGASVREIAEVTGIPFKTVDRIIARVRARSTDEGDAPPNVS